MTGRVLGFGGLALALAALALGSACASMQVPNNPTTQALGEAGAVTGAVAPTIAVAAPAPWGQILAGILGAFSVIAGIIAHSTVSKNSAQQVTNAVTAGLQAASQSLGLAPSSAGSASASAGAALSSNSVSPPAGK